MASPLRWPVAAALGLTLACGRGAEPAKLRHAAAAGDSGFAGVQDRGASAMGVNQYTSTHIFEPLPDGGRIELQRDVEDSSGIAQIRGHMALIAERFKAGDFSLPGFVHARAVPGTDVMAAKRAVIDYSVESLPRGEPCACGAPIPRRCALFTTSSRFSATTTTHRRTTTRSTPAG